MKAEIKGGQALAAKLAELSNIAKKPGLLRVGFLEGADYPGGQPVAMVAAIHNFGAPAASIPKRPFFTRMVEEHSSDWGDDIAKRLRANDLDVEQALMQMGDLIKSQLQDSIVDTNDPPLSEITRMLRMMRIEKRKEDPDWKVTGRAVGEAAARVAAGERAHGINEKVLIDTAHMIDSVGYKVET